jgi:hypothetical protein
MITVKNKQVFTSTVSGARIRVRSVTKNLADPVHSLVEVVNIADNGRAYKDTVRTIYQDSIRRWYM